MELGGLASTHPHCSRSAPTPSLCPPQKSTSQILVKYIVVPYVILTEYKVASGPSLRSSLTTSQPRSRRDGASFRWALCVSIVQFSLPFHTPATCSGGAVRAAGRGSDLSARHLFLAAPPPSGRPAGPVRRPLGRRCPCWGHVSSLLYSLILPKHILQ